MGEPGQLIYRDDSSDFPIEIREAPPLRWLEFGDGAIQSVIDLQRPERLPSAVARAMLAGLLFVSAPRRMLILGGGGGALPRYLHHRAPRCEGTVVERSAAVARLARRFFAFPGEGSKWRLLEADARDFVRVTRERYDMVMMDIAEGLDSPGWLAKGDFLHHCRERLDAQGVLVINLIVDDAAGFALTLSRIREGFGRRTLCLSVPGHRNVVVFAFNAPPRYREPGPLRQRIPTLKHRWGLEFDEFLQRMRAENPEGSGVF